MGLSAGSIAQPSSSIPAGSTAKEQADLLGDPLAVVGPARDVVVLVQLDGASAKGVKVRFSLQFHHVL